MVEFLFIAGPAIGFAVAYAVVTARHQHLVHIARMRHADRNRAYRALHGRRSGNDYA